MAYLLLLIQLMAAHIQTDNQFQIAPKTYFVCIDCETRFSVSEDLYAESAFRSNCPKCEREIGIQTSQAQSSMVVLELFGCEFKFIDRNPQPASTLKPQSKEEILEWIDSAQEKESSNNIQASPFEGQETFLDNLVAKWVVKSKLGQKEFEYFSVLRQAIEAGEVDGKDQIIAPDGNKFHVATYPGTSDLFGNSFIKNAARSKMSGQSSKVKRAFNFTKTLVQGSLLLGVSLFLASFAFYGPQYYKQWQQFKGRKVVSQLTQEIAVAPQETTENLVLQAQQMFKEGIPENLPSVVLQYQKALAREPKSPEIMFGLSEAMSEISSLTFNRADLAQARQLVLYAKTLAPASALSIRAEARILWKEGKSDEALNLLESSGTLENESTLLVSQIAEEKGDFTKSTLRLSEIVQKDPSNPKPYVLLSKLFEKQNKFAQAVIYLQKAAQMNLSSNAYSEQIALLFEKGGDFDSAALMYRQSIQKGVHGEENRYKLTKLYFSQKRPSDVIEASLEFLSNHAESKYEPEVRSMYQSSMASLRPAIQDNNNSPRKSRRGSRSTQG